MAVGGMLVWAVTVTGVCVYNKARFKSNIKELQLTNFAFKEKRWFSTKLVYPV